MPRDRRDALGEGPLWSARDGALYWVDILGARLNRLRLADDRIDSWDLPEMTGWVIEQAGTADFIAGLRSGFHRLSLDPLTLTPLARLDTEPPGNRMNDAKADAAGRIWAPNTASTTTAPASGASMAVSSSASSCMPGRRAYGPHPLRRLRYRSRRLELRLIGRSAPRFFGA